MKLAKQVGVVVAGSIFLGGCLHTGTQTPSTPQPTSAAEEDDQIAPGAITPTHEAATAEENQVVMHATALVPETIKIRSGESITRVNQDPLAHTVTGFDGVDETLNQGESLTQTLTEAGTFEYECTIHPGTTGTVMVKECMGRTINKSITLDGLVD